MNRLLVAASFTLIMLASAKAATVTPHRAIYDLTLTRSGNGSTLSTAQGRMAFEVQGSTCEGWTVSFRMATRYTPSNGEASMIDTRSTTYESADALDFRHQVKELINGEVKEDSRLKVTRPSVNAQGQGEMSTKEGSTFVVPAGAALPMQHQLKLMALGEAGGGRDASTIYDGSDGEKSFRAISFVGKAKPPGSVTRDLANPEAAPLSGLASWPMTVSYFPGSGGEETPDYQISFDMYENGVATGLLLDYGSFALSGKLAKLDMLDIPSCQ